MRATVEREQLVRVPLLGLMTTLERTVIFLCPQQGCGMPMVFDADKCVYTERGYACAACSHRIRTEENQPVTDLVLPEQMRCTMCDKVLRNPRSAFLYPMNTILCARHHRPFERICAAFSAHGSFHSQQEVIQLLQQVYKNIQEEITVKYASWNKYLLQRSKLATRSKPRSHR